VSIVINKVLVANRGEIAVRILRTCKELGLETVAVFSEADRESPHVRYADEAYFIGPSPAQDSYLQGERIIQVALQAGAQAIHPGYGFLAESSKFAQACVRAGLVFIGPRQETIKLMGDKVVARKLAHRLNLDVLPGSSRSLNDTELVGAAEQIGFPVLVKAAVGVGGIGVRVVHSRSELKTAISLARQEARTVFGDSTIYVERFIENARHIEVQVLGDRRGHVIHLGERECSIQRRHQNIIDEAPSRALDFSLRKQVLEAAIRVASTLGYLGAGTVEFLLDTNGKFYFLEVNPRLQVEHTVTEAVTGVDIVKEQLRIAAGRNLHYTQDEIQPRGWALECRILAEQSNQLSMKNMGCISRLVEPGGPGVRVDSGICEGLTITTFYDPLLAKLVTWGETRAVAIVRMRRALEEYQILGVATNLDLHRALLDSHRFFGGQFHTQFLEEEFAPPDPGGEDRLAAALTTALLDWRKRVGAHVTRDQAVNAWKMLGRWEVFGGD
jgi:acetyl-CoA carboxylase biotin carboxylase subunit